MAKSVAEEKLQEEFERFVQFGAILDSQTRKYLVQYLKSKLGLKAIELPEINDTYFRYFSKSMDKLFDEGKLVNLLQGRAGLTLQVASDTLYWLRKTFGKIREKNPFEEETSRLNAASVMPLRAFVERWFYTTNFLKNEYQKDQLDVGFYEEKFKELIGQKDFAQLETEERNNLEDIFKDMLAQWDALLSAKLLEFQLGKLEDEAEDFKELLDKKADEYQKLFELISPFSEYVGKYWDMSRELWEDTSFSVLEKYNDLLEKEDSIKELADLLGQMREAEIITEEEEYERVIVRKEWVDDNENKAEIVGIHESDDLSNLVSSEIGYLGDEETESIFLKKYADKGLQTFRYQDKYLVQSEDQFTETNLKTKLKEKGPFIICVDTSDSMHGLPEKIAKVLCFGILKMAAKDNRRAYLINFSTQIQTIDLYDIGRSLDEIAGFLRMSFHGGTDITLALHEALRQLQSESYRDADVLIISDFIMYKVADEILDRVRFHQQNNGTQFHSLTLHEDPNAEVILTFDTNWVYDPKSKGIIRELSGEMRKITKR
ncbi:MAG: VWA domain-containing protein [Bacteroidia bacterium]|nr:VWA domain-containing protein [Bacteroidia bacterium]